MNYWVFKCNPARYRIDDRLADPNPREAWRVTRFADKVAAGDIAFVWRTGPLPGICAVLVVEASPELMDGDPDDPYVIDLDQGPMTRCWCVFASRGFFLTESELMAVAELRQMSVFRWAKQGTNYPLETGEGEAILSMLSGRLSG